MANDKKENPRDDADLSFSELFRGLGLEIRLKKDDDFLKVKETLTRIGIASKKDRALYQSCHILHKRGRFAIVHFKELFVLDGKPSDISENDIARRNTIAKLLLQWGLIELVKPLTESDPLALLNQIKIVKHSEKQNWNLVAKYSIGKKRNPSAPVTEDDDDNNS
jgi:hypothetical protein